MASGPVRSMKKKSRRSPGPATVGGGAPALTAWAARTMSERAAWRKMSVRRTTGTVSDSMRSSSTRPGPTGASWSTSPTSRTCVRGPTAPKSASARRTDSIEASSTMSTSVPGIGSSGPRAKPSSGAYSSSRWMVVAGAPVISASRRAALPVGRAQPHRALLRLQKVDERAHGHRLARARTAGEDREPALEHGAAPRPTGRRWGRGSPVGRSIAPRRRRGSSVDELAHVAGQSRLDAVHGRVEDALALDPPSRPRAARSSIRSSASAPSMRRARSASSVRGR
jgi:hypothetical protein